MKLLGIALVLAAAVLTGCSSLSCGDPHPYLNSGVTPPLKAPVGLSVPAPDPAYAIAGVTASAGKRTDLNAAGACLISPPQVVPSASGSSVKPTGSSGAGTMQPPTAAPTGTSGSAAKPAAPTPAPSVATSRSVPEA